MQCIGVLLLGALLMPNARAYLYLPRTTSCQNLHRPLYATDVVLLCLSLFYLVFYKYFLKIAQNKCAADANSRCEAGVLL